MPAFPPIANVIKWELFWTQNGTPAANILHTSFTGTSNVTDIEALATTLGSTVMSSSIEALYPTTTELVQIVGTDLTSNTSPVGSQAIGRSGTFSGNLCAAQVCMLTSWKINTRYRGGHPRTYWVPPNSQEQESQSLWSPTTVTAFQTMSQALLNTWSVSTHGTMTLSGLGAVSYYDKALNPTPPYRRTTPVFYAFTGSGVENILRTQRRRVLSSSY